MNNEGIIAKYVEHMTLLNLRQTTVYGRKRALIRLGHWVNGPVLYLTEAQLKAWQSWHGSTVVAQTLRSDTSHIRQFYDWAQREGYRDDNPGLRLVMPKVRRRLPRPMADKLIIDAMAAADIYIRAILALASFAGLRAMEIALLDWSEITLMDKPRVRIEGKGGIDRIVPLSSALVDVITQLPHRKGAVIPRIDGRSGYNSSPRISCRANDYLHDMGIRETLHQCRHRFATVTYQACRDIRAVQDLLGHASPTTTAIYALSSNAVAIDAVEQAGSLMPAAS